MRENATLDGQPKLMHASARIDMHRRLCRTTRNLLLSQGRARHRHTAIAHRTTGPRLLQNRTAMNVERTSTPTWLRPLRLLPLRRHPYRCVFGTLLGFGRRVDTRDVLQPSSSRACLRAHFDYRDLCVFEHLDKPALLHQLIRHGGFFAKQQGESGDRADALVGRQPDDSTTCRTLSPSDG
ncbi:hypothetical protein BH160DRAFT_2849 [Burkholderia sp. H160]|nr:hypothetical protein BH160DRAFT_2849 [Burkholderia sp. H160]